MGDLQQTFDQAKRVVVLAWITVVADHGRKNYPPLPIIKARFCRKADELHRLDRRVYAHSLHHRNTVCWAKAAPVGLSTGEIVGIYGHELGHIVAMLLKLPGHVNAKSGSDPRAQREADDVARRILGIPIRYNRRKIQEWKVEIGKVSGR